MKKSIQLLLFVFIYLIAIRSNAQQTTAKKYHLWYNKPAPNRGGDMKIVKARGKPFDEDWENWSLPIGNGYLGASIFGRTDTERIQLTENSLSNKGQYNIGSLTNFGEILIDFNQQNISNYVRSLDLEDAVARVKYTCDNVNYTREYFASYPDKVLVIKLKADQASKLNFTMHPYIPYLRNPDTSRIKDGRTGKVFTSNNTITLSGNMQYYNIDYEGQIKVIPYGGKLLAKNDAQNDHGTIELINADSALILVALGTNYQMKSSVFKDTVPSKKLEGFPHPHNKVQQIVEAAMQKSSTELMQAHLKDYHHLYERVKVNLMGKMPSIPTDELLANYKNGILDRYLEELYFQFGRYLLIASSRIGTLPSNLQGIWTQYDISPWTSGYWHNINVQMNYWPAFNTNLASLFTSYQNYNEAFRDMAIKNADHYIKLRNPTVYDSISGNNGWTIGTSASPYAIGEPGGHSGPGTGGFTTKLFWDQYDFSRDINILRKSGYPTMLSMVKFLSKTLKDTLGFFLASPSASPEQRHNNTYYQTVGCAFDQQMIYESMNDVLKSAKLLNDNNATITNIKHLINKLDPIQVGWSGQIKEYREEKKYGEIGEYKHRHISHLVGLYPGTIINAQTPAWMDAARRTLIERGNISTGWAMAHRLNLWARIKEGDTCFILLRNLLQRSTNNNLWDTHPPFQIDGNFGSTAGIAEMLLQSHEGYVEPLAALPTNWANGNYAGLIARGNFEVAAAWENEHATLISIISKAGGICKIKYPNISGALLKNKAGKPLPFKVIAKDLISFSTNKNESFSITNIPLNTKVIAPSGLQTKKSNDATVQISWNSSIDAVAYNVYVANNSEPSYTLIASIKSNNQFVFKPSQFNQIERATIKVTAVNKTGKESVGALAYFVQ
jgi:alpha-L-fucosidase 2